MLGWAGQGMGAKQVVLRHGLGLNWVTAKRTQQSVCGGGGGGVAAAAALPARTSEPQY